MVEKGCVGARVLDYITLSSLLVNAGVKLASWAF